MTFINISFDDNTISTEKLQRMSDNDEYFYTSVLTKPRGLIGIKELTSDYTNTTGPGFEAIFDDIILTPSTATRLLGLYVYLPVYSNDSGATLDASTIQILKDGVPIQVGYTDTKYYTDGVYDKTSFILVALDLRPQLSPHTYRVEIFRSTVAGDQVIAATADRPAQFWVEDLGDASGL